MYTYVQKGIIIRMLHVHKLQMIDTENKDFHAFPLIMYYA